MLSATFGSRRIISAGLVGAIFAASAPNVRAEEPLPETSGVPDLVPLVPMTVVPTGGTTSEPAAGAPLRPDFEGYRSDKTDITCTEVEACFKTAIQKFNEGNFREAAALFIQTYDLAPKKESRLQLLLLDVAISYEHAGDPSNALRYYREYVKRLNKESNRGNIQITSRYEALSFYVEGIDFLERRDYANALRSLLKVQRLLSSDNPPASLCSEIGGVYQANGQKDEALAQYRACLDKVTVSGKYPAVKERLEEKIAALSNIAGERVLGDEVYQMPGIKLEDAPAEASADDSSPTDDTFLSRHARSLLVAGGAVAATGVGIGLNYAGNARFEELARNCGQTPAGCSQSDIDALKRYFTGRDISYVTGGIALAAGVAIFIAESLYNPKPTGDRVSFQLQPDGTFVFKY